MGYADDGERVSIRVQRVDVKQALRSAQKMKLGGNVVAQDGGRSYTQNKENGQKTRVNYEDGQYVARLWLPSKEGEAQEETEKVS